LKFTVFEQIVKNTCCTGQQGEKSQSIIPFPRVGRSDSRFYATDKRNGNQPGLIPFPRIGRDGGGNYFLHGFN